MKPIKIISFIIILLCTYSCKNTDNLVKDDFIAKKSNNITKPISQLTIDSLDFPKDTMNLLFIVDARCSTCISVFIDELSMIKETKLIENRNFGQMVVLLPKGTSKIMSFYISKKSPYQISDFKLIESSTKESNIAINSYNGYFYTIENGIFTGMWVPNDL